MHKNINTVVSLFIITTNSFVTLPKATNTSKFACVTLPFVHVYFFTKLILLQSLKRPFNFYKLLSETCGYPESFRDGGYGVTATFC